MLVPNVMKKIYGGGKASAMYGVMFSYTGIMSILMVILQGALLTTNAKSYDAFFYVDALCSILSLILLLTLFREEKYVYVLPEDEQKLSNPKDEGTFVVDANSVLQPEKENLLSGEVAREENEMKSDSDKV